MKRLLTLTLALLLALTLAGLGGAYAYAEEDPYVGLWEITGQQEGDAYTAYADMGVTAYLEFRSNGAIYAVMTDGQNVIADYMAYKVTGDNALDIYEGDDPLPSVYDPATGVISVTDSDGGLVSFVERVTADPLPDIRALVDNSQDEQTFYGYRMNEGDQTMDILEVFPAMGMDPRDFYLELEPDGTGYLQFGSEEQSSELTWTETEFIVDGEGVPYAWEGDHILLSIDESNSIEFAPEGEVEALMAMLGIEIAEPAETVDIDVEVLPGEWKLLRAVYAGQTLTAEQIKEYGLEMSFTFNADGTAAMTSNGTVTDGLKWTVEGEELSLSVGSYDLFTLTYDGECLMLDMMAQLYFEKIG